LQQIQTLTLGHAIHDVDDYYIGQLLACKPKSTAGANVSGAYNGYFLSHERSFKNGIMPEVEL
jgi:hypothetical protein